MIDQEAFQLYVRLGLENLDTLRQQNDKIINGLAADLFGLVGQVQALRREMKEVLGDRPPETEPIGEEKTFEEMHADHEKSARAFHPLFYKRTIDEMVRGSVVIELGPVDGWKTFKRINIKPCLAAAGLIYDQEGDCWTEKLAPKAPMQAPAPVGNKPVLNDDGDMV